MRRAMNVVRPKTVKLLRWAKVAAVGMLLLHGTACGQATAPAVKDPHAAAPPAPEPLRTGADRIEAYLPLLAGKRVGVVTNHTGLIGTTHLVDSLLAAKVDLVKVFAPEHGFRGDADAGETVKDGTDQRTGLPLVSLYGRNKKPTAAQLADVDVLLFDIQDVGVRFYTYIGTLHYVMEAAAETGKGVIVLDRPNPNGHYVDGPVLDTAYRSFVGMHPVPLVHGMTVGEFAGMINGEGWLAHGARCELTVITCTGYDHQVRYALPVRPSPNLPNMASVYLYPSVGLFEGTIVSLGRGTGKPFQLIGYPGNPVGDVQFTPMPGPGSKDPPQKGKLCTGLDLSNVGEAMGQEPGRVRLEWLIALYQAAPDKKNFFLANRFMDKLAGGDALRKAVAAGQSEEVIRESWRPGLEAFMPVRASYLLYP